MLEYEYVKSTQKFYDCKTRNACLFNITEKFVLKGQVLSQETILFVYWPIRKINTPCGLFLVQPKLNDEFLKRPFNTSFLQSLVQIFFW